MVRIKMEVVISWVLWTMMMSGATLLACYFVVKTMGRRLNEWYYDFKLGDKRRFLPPGDMGWPLIGKTLFFIKDLRSGDSYPDLFINHLVFKYGKIGMYKTHLFMNPGIFVCTLDASRKIMSDENNFKLGYPETTLTVTQSPLTNVSGEEHKRFRRLIIAPILGYNSLAKFLDPIEEIVIESLKGMASRSTEQPIMLIKETMALSLRIIVHIFIGSYHHHDTIKQVEHLLHAVDDALFSMPINFPGFPYYKALKNRKKVEEILKSIVEERKVMIKNGSEVTEKKDLVDILLEVEDVNGRKLKGEDIVNMLITLFLAGHAGTATALMWSVIFLTKNTFAFQKAKEEQEEILKSRPPSQKHLSIEEIKKMVYLKKVFNEVMRVTEWAIPFCREAITDVNINGYIIPKGWRVFIWPRICHLSSEYFSNPKDFNPSRWDKEDFTKGGAFFPFGVGTRMCVGRDLLKVEMLIFLHHFVLNYKFEQINPECPLSYMIAPLPKDNCLGKVTKVSME
ncbi:hypothetical protein PIB30_041768 [Stylosanthes scabra]|uniref:Beta-amyrin 11-oxidase-like n=1 Tax=Stylosanthes scabra TaxID=79078 RepID=A0ABU6TFQ6_9FABA|nr:hypothetical protein [Stylosanthes scabra]